jgi:hypothetical protein
LRAAAIQLERLTFTFSRRRRRAIRRAWMWLSSYEDYKIAWQNTEEKRILTDRGIMNGFMFDPDEDGSDEE